MSKKSVFLIILLAMVVVLSSITPISAKTQCLVVRKIDPANTLWISKCEDGTCGPFSQISGRFTSQPAVVWDHDTYRYYLYGTGMLGAVYRRALNMICQPIGGWEKMMPDGFSASPIGAAAGNLYDTFNAVAKTSRIDLRYWTKNLLALKVVVPDDGFVLCRAFGTINFRDHVGECHGADLFEASIRITRVSQGWDTQPVRAYLHGLPCKKPGGTGMSVSFPFGIERWFTENGRIDRTYYLTGTGSSYTPPGSDSEVEAPSMTCEFKPYSF